MQLESYRRLGHRYNAPGVFREQIQRRYFGMERPPPMSLRNLQVAA